MPFPDDSIANEAGVIKTGSGDQSSELGAVNQGTESHRFLHELLEMQTGEVQTRGG